MEFGVPHSLDEIKHTTSTKPAIIKETQDATPLEIKRQGRRSPLDNYNSSYDSRKLRLSVDFLQHNIEKIRQKSDDNCRSSTKTLKVSCDESVGHNYSSSTKNSTELAKKKIRSVLADQPNTRFTYSQVIQRASFAKLFSDHIQVRVC